MLMERLGCSPAEAQAQLEHLSAESGTNLAELAAQITGQLTAPAPLDAGESASPPRDAQRIALAGAPMETARDGDSLASAMLEEALAPAGAAALALWLTEPDGGLELAGQAGVPAPDA